MIMTLQRKRSTLYAVLGIAGIAGVGALYANLSSSTETTIAALAKETHFHGIAVDVADHTRLYLATHHGLYVIASDGRAQRISETRDDFMGFTAHPADSSVLFASGHPADGGNLGFITSIDRGQTWKKLSDGVHGPVDFHQMDVSKADPKVIYGVYGDLERSSDGGGTWSWIGPVPMSIVALAASSRDVNIVYAATESGVLRSSDGGKSWQATGNSGHPVTMVHVTHSGRIYAFTVGVGLVLAAETDLVWQAISNGFGENYVVHLTTDPSDQERLYAITYDNKTRSQNVIMSKDGGVSWTKLGIAQTSEVPR